PAEGLPDPLAHPAHPRARDRPGRRRPRHPGHRRPGLPARPGGRGRSRRRPGEGDPRGPAPPAGAQPRRPVSPAVGRGAGHLGSTRGRACRTAGAWPRGSSRTRGRAPGLDARARLLNGWSLAPRLLTDTGPGTWARREGALVERLEPGPAAVVLAVFLAFPGDFC